MSDLNPVQIFAIAVLPVLFAITVHEVAHGWVARRLGDPTALMLGRLTLNPIKHIDPVGTVIVPALLLLSNSGLMFGWAKPVPITTRNLRHPERDMAWIAVAGPSSNILMALIWAGIWKFANIYGGYFPSFYEPLQLMAQYGVIINLVLAMLNMLPVPPLDGSRVLAAFLPGPWVYRMSRFEVYGFIIIAVLLYTHILDFVLWPPIAFLMGLIESLFGL